MATSAKEMKDNALSVIDSALAILNKYPDLNQTDVSLSINKLLNPLPFLMDLFKRTAGYNTLINIISKFIAWNIPLIDAGVKGVLITKLKDIISCSVNPFFTEEILRDGIAFDIKEIDISDVLKYSPFDEKIGQYFYFDCNNFETEVEEWNPITETLETKKQITLGIPDDLKKSDDLNALIWYVINKSNRRQVWKPKKYRKGSDFRNDYPTDENSANDYKEDIYDRPKQELDEAYQGGEITVEQYNEKIEELTKKWEKYQNNFQKLKKEDGIITLEYHKKATNIKNAYGGQSALQTPYHNCLQVFIGDARENSNNEDIETLTQTQYNIKKEDKNIDKYNKKIIEKRKEIEKLTEDKQNLPNKGYSDEKDLKKEYDKIQKKINKLEREIENIKDKRNTSYQEKRRLNSALQRVTNVLERTSEQYFPFIKDGKIRNYYYGKSLIEFNIDYITSLTLFDSKSLTARLLDCMTASLIIDLHLTYKQQLIKNEVKKMVKMITETDDLVVSDCFFTFSNKDYDEMSAKAELRKAGLLTINGDETSAVKIDAEKIFEKINQISDDANKETVQTIINGTITELSKELSSTEYVHQDNTGHWKEFIHGKNENYGVEINFIENILNSLAEVMTLTVLSPKVYLLLLINLKIIGRETNFNLEGFLIQYKQLIAEIIRSIRDIILEYLTQELMIIIGDLVKEITIKLTIEQTFYYQRLLKRLIECFKFRRKNKNPIDFSIDDVDYADILTSEDTPKEQEC